jgi:hypothetical protein
MRKILAAALLAVPLLAGCAYVPRGAEPITYDDSPADIRACRRLGAVSDLVATTPGFEARLNEMRDATLALGGTDLFLAKPYRDWSFVQGIAYRCPAGGLRSEVTVIRVRY